MRACPNSVTPTAAIHRKCVGEATTARDAVAGRIIDRINRAESRSGIYRLPSQRFVFSFLLREDSLFVITQDFIRRPCAFLRTSFHVALEIDRAVFPREVAIAGALAFGARECGVLAFLPI